MRQSTCMQGDIDNILGEIAAKDSQVLCREVLSIGDTMGVLRSKWTVEILTAILCGNTRFKDILTAIHVLRDKVLTERLRQMVLSQITETLGKEDKTPWWVVVLKVIAYAIGLILAGYGTTAAAMTLNTIL